MGIRSLSTASISTGVKRSKVWDQSAEIITSDYELIERITLSSTASTITFSSIPQTYKHLEVRGMTKSAYSNSGVGGSQYKIQFNGDTTASNYSFRQFNSNGNGFSSSATGSTDVWGIAAWDGAGGFSGALYIPMIMRIPDYTSTNKNKTAIISEGFSGNTTSTNQYVTERGATRYNTSAITSITFDSSTPYADGVWASGTTFALYGLRGA